VRTLYCDQMLVSSLLRLQLLVISHYIQDPHLQSPALLLPTSFGLFNLTLPHAPFHHSFQPLALLPSFPPSLVSYFLLCQTLYLKQPFTSKATKSSKKCPFWSVLHWFPTVTIFQLF